MNKVITVKLRVKPLRNGMARYFLDYYPAIEKEDGVTTRREFLSLKKIYAEPKGWDQKEHNKGVRIKADKILNDREFLLENGGNPLIDLKKKSNAIDFIAFFEKLSIERSSSSGNSGIWFSCLSHFKFFLGSDMMSFDKVSDFLVEDFKSYLEDDAVYLKRKAKEPLKQNTKCSYFIKFKCCLNEAKSKGLIEGDWIDKVKLIPDEETEREFLTSEEINSLINFPFEDHSIYQAAIFSIYTGLRFSDIHNLKWQNIQKRNEEDLCYLSIKQKKTGRNISNPFPKLDFLQFDNSMYNSSDFVFPFLKYSNTLNDNMQYPANEK